MSDERRSTPDISKIVSLIMENPHIIEEISALAGAETEAPRVEEKTESIPTYKEAQTPSRERRAQLLSALKPYLSGERQKAVDSMITFADIFDTMRGKV